MTSEPRQPRAEAPASPEAPTPASPLLREAYLAYWQSAEGAGSVQPRVVQRLVEAVHETLRSTPPAAPLDRPTDPTCEKCGSGNVRTFWHHGLYGEPGEPNCLYSDRWHQGERGEHMHCYCQNCRFGWRAIVAALGVGAESSKEAQ